MGVPAVGSNSSLVVGFESTYGTSPAANVGKTLGFVNWGVKSSRALIDNPQISADPNYRDAVRGKRDNGGSMQMVLGPKVLPLIQKMITGQLATTGTTNKVHVSKILAGAIPSFTAEAKLDYGTPQYVLHNGLMVESAKFGANAEGFLTCDLGLVGAKSSVSGTGLFTAPTDLATGVVFDHSKILAADVLLGGSAYGSLVDFSVEINNALNKDDYRVGRDGARASVSRGKVKVSGSITTMFDNMTLYNILVGTASTSMKLKWTIDANTYFQIELPRVWFSVTDPTINDAGPIQLTADFSGVYDNTAASSIVLTTGNDQADTVYA